MIDEHVQESAVEGPRAILAWSQGSALRYAQRSTVATRWHCCAVLASAIPKTDEIPSYALSPRITSPKMMNPIGRVCVSSRVCSQFIEIRKRKSAWPWKSDVRRCTRSRVRSGVPGPASAVAGRGHGGQPKPTGDDQRVRAVRSLLRRGCRAMCAPGCAALRCRLRTGNGYYLRRGERPHGHSGRETTLSRGVPGKNEKRARHRDTREPRSASIVIVRTANRPT